LLATYASRSSAGGSQIVSKTTNTIRPKPRSAMPGASAWASHTAASTLTAWTRRHVDGSRSGRAARSNAAAADQYRALADGALRAWQEEFIRDDGTLAVQSQASHVRALAFGLAPDKLRAAVAARLAELIGLADGHLGTGFLSTGYLLPTLAETGHLGLAYDLLRQDTAPSWLTMVDRGATTTWEDWNGVDADGVPHGSLNHYSKGAVATFLHRYVAGLRPTVPGYRRFEVRPRPGGGITWADTCHVGPFGPIKASWRVDGGSMELDVQVPGGTTATVVMPGADPHDVGPGRHRWTGAAPTRLRPRAAGPPGRTRRRPGRAPRSGRAVRGDARRSAGSRRRGRVSRPWR
jgi:hypothetical protein